MVDIGATVESKVEVGATVEAAMTLPKALDRIGKNNGLALGMAGVHGVPVHSGGPQDLRQVDSGTGGQVER